MHGISISYPAGWSIQRASEPWRGEPFYFREPVGDFLYDPSLTDHLFLALASQPLAGRSTSSWAADLLAAEGCDATEPVVVDGAEGLIGSDCGVVLTGIDDRGYIIWLYLSDDDPAVREVHNRAWFDQVLATVQLNPQNAAAAPSESPISTPSTIDLVWSPESAEHDWPGPIRKEPDDAPNLVITDNEVADPTGEFARGVPGWIDIREVVRQDSSLYVFLDEPLTDVRNPAQAWVAYGLVVDLDHDGVADYRVGMDNVGLGGQRRGWGTDLHTGVTMVGALDWSTSIGAFSGYGLEEEGLPDDSMYFRWIQRWIQLDPGAQFYVWASLIRDGMPVATDFAPDLGWMPVRP